MDAIPFLITFFEQIDVFMLIMVRVIGFFLFVPVISGMSIPMQVRLTLAFCFSAAIFSSGLVVSATFYNSVPGFFMLILVEFLTGVLMGYILMFIFNIMLFVGQQIDFKMGFAMMSVMDPLMQIQVPIMGNLFFIAISALLVVTGGLHWFIEAFFYSYEILPMGTANIIGNADLAHFFITHLTLFFMIAVQIALPVVGALTLIDISLGIMVKAVPQMNVFVIGMPIKVFVGLFLMLLVMIPTLGWIYNVIFNRALESMIVLIRGLAQ